MSIENGHLEMGMQKRAEEVESSGMKNIASLLEGYAGTEKSFADSDEERELYGRVERELHNVDIETKGHIFVGAQETMFVLDLDNGLSILGSTDKTGEHVQSVVRTDSLLREDYIREGEKHVQDLEKELPTKE